MKKLAVVHSVAILVLATGALAGTLTVNGNLTVSTNLTAQSITLGEVTQTSWPSGLAIQGHKYVIVAEGTNDVQRGSNLQAAYATATTLNPTSSNRVVVLVPPGSYNLGTTGLTMNTSYVDLLGLVLAQMTSKQGTKTIASVQCPVLIYGSASAGTLVQSVDYVRIESVVLTNTGSGAAYGSSVYGGNTVLRHVSMSSMSGPAYAGQYVDSVGGDSAFGGGSAATGTFVDCVAGNNGFGGGNGDASGTFIGCTSGDESFAGSGGNASGTFIDCVGGADSFGNGDGGGNGNANGTFRGCVAGNKSFGYNAPASGTFIDCVAGEGGFGSIEPNDQDQGSPVASGTFINCVGGSYSFGGGAGLDNAAKLQHCQAGTGSFGSFNMASQDFNYNVGGANTFVMLPNLPTSTNGLPSGSVWSSNGVLRVAP